MKYHRALREQLGLGIRMALERVSVSPQPTAPAPISEETPGAEVPRDFHRRMAAIIDLVQTAIWQRGVHELLGYSTDYALGQQRGLQTLVLKTRRRSAYVRVHWDTLMSDAPDERARVDSLVQSAIQQLA